MKKYLILLSILLTSCGTTEVIQNSNNGTLSISGRYGAMIGGWDRASTEATAAAKQYCEKEGNVYQFISEQRTGVPGFTQLESTINFTCNKNIEQILKSKVTECNNRITKANLYLIKDKLYLYSSIGLNPPTFSLLTNNSFPSKEEKEQISIWAKIRESCNAEFETVISSNSKGYNPQQNLFIEKEKSYRESLRSNSNQLIVALYEDKITYGEFAQKNYEITKEIIDSERDYRSALLTQDYQNQIRLQELANEQQQNRINAWSVYMQSVNARQPYTVKLQSNCVSNKIGNTVNTNCY